MSPNRKQARNPPGPWDPRAPMRMRPPSLSSASRPLWPETTCLWPPACVPSPADTHKGWELLTPRGAGLVGGRGVREGRCRTQAGGLVTVPTRTLQGPDNPATRPQVPVFRSEHRAARCSEMVPSETKHPSKKKREELITLDTGLCLQQDYFTAVSHTHTEAAEWSCRQSRADY